MADPIELYIVPNCGLKIQPHDPQSDPPITSDSLHNSIGNIASKQEGRKYKVYNNKALPLSDPTSEETYEGWMSPISPVTLPFEIKKLAGVPEKATQFAYIYPPEGLAPSIDWSKVRLFPNEIDEQSLTRVDEWAIPMVALVGGFVYFDEKTEPLCVNAISLLPTTYKIRFSGPFDSVQEVREDLQSLNRVHPMTMGAFNECNYVAIGWVNPSETFGAKTVANNCPLDNSGGSFILYRDNGTAFVYVLDNFGYHEPTGLKSTIGPAFEAMTQTAMDFQSGQGLNQPSIVFHDSNLLLDSERAVRMRRSIKNVTNVEKLKDFQQRNLAEEPNTILHMACQTKCSTEVVKQLIKMGEDENLLHKNNFGWIPLFYACRYNPDNLDLVKLLVQSEPASIETHDAFNRFPLHIAIDARCSKDIIEYLLKKNPQASRHIILQPTLLLERLPIHLACNREVDVDIIEMLLDADKMGSSMTKKTRSGRLPLHLALERKLPPRLIELLLRGGNNKLSKLRPEVASSCNDTISARFNGMLPIHIAVWNNSLPETIAILLELDPNSINETVHGEFDVKAEAQSRMVTMQNVMKEVHRMNALHLALTHGNTKVIELLLQRETSKARTSVRANTVLARDCQERLPLHLACIYSQKNSEAVIKRLLDLDGSKISTHGLDIQDNTPLHYACDKSDANPETVERLLSGEEKFLMLKEDAKRNIRREDRPVGRFIESEKRASHYLNEEKESPLFLAIQGGAKEKVLEHLLQQEHFFLKGSDTLIGDLSKSVSENKALQGLIIDKLAERSYFFMLLVDLYCHIAALISFLLAADTLLNSKDVFLIDMTSISILWVSIIIGVVRELIRMRSQGGHYFWEIWTWIELGNISLLTVSTVSFMSLADRTVEGNGINRNLLITTSTMAVLQLTFFLRTTFEPFARFVGGLTLIFQTLIPFFIVSGLLLLAFAYGFRVSHNDASCLANCEEDACGMCQANLGQWYYWVLGGFFSGADSTDSPTLDILFGLTAIVILLNVVIAIVSDAWEVSSFQSQALFWKFRLEFLSESRLFTYMEKRICKGSHFARLSEFIDQIPDIKIADDTPWAQKPLSNVMKSKEEYYRPEDYFTSDLARQIRKGHSLNAELYWIKMDGGNATFCLKCTAMMRWLLLSVLYCLLIMLGALTGGWFWPKNFRRRVLSFGL